MLVHLPEAYGPVETLKCKLYFQSAICERIHDETIQGVENSTDLFFSLMLHIVCLRYTTFKFLIDMDVTSMWQTSVKKALQIHALQRI